VDSKRRSKCTRVCTQGLFDYYLNVVLLDIIFFNHFDVLLGSTKHAIRFVQRFLCIMTFFCMLSLAFREELLDLKFLETNYVIKFCFNFVFLQTEFQNIH